VTVVGTGAIAAGGIRPFGSLIREVADEYTLLELRWLVLSVTRPSPESWESLAREVVAAYLMTEPPMFLGDSEVIVTLPMDWPGPIPQDTAVKFLPWGSVYDLAQEHGDIKYIGMSLESASLTTLRVGLASAVEYRVHPRIVGCCKAEHIRIYACRPGLIRWRCRVDESDA
jgi:hypothetical protein